MLKRLLFASFLFLSNAYAATAAEQVTALLQHIHSLEADFHQKTVAKNEQIVQESSGHMLLVRPGKFRWQVTQPNQQIIITNGQHLWIYDPDLEQVTIRNLAKSTGETPALLLSDASLDLGHDFRVQQSREQKDGSQIFLLVPKDQSAMFSALKLTFLNNDIKAMDLQNQLGQTTHISFSNNRLNKMISTNQFNFKAPKGVDVIDETQQASE